jgi:hypothetical protein
MKARQACLLAALVLTTGCGSLGAQEQPAVIVAPTAETRAELARVVGGAGQRKPGARPAHSV